MNLFLLERLEEAEEKFRSRQSRPEDLEVIEQLKRALAERELDMKKLVVSDIHSAFGCDQGSLQGSIVGESVFRVLP